MFTIVIFPLLLISCASGASLHDNSPKCGCYTADSADGPQYFLYHRFYDFRSLAKSPSQYTIPPPLVTQPGGNEITRDQDVLNSTGFTDDWDIQSWGKKATGDATYDMWNSAQNVYISRYSDLISLLQKTDIFSPAAQTNASDLSSTDPSETTYLTLRTSRQSTFQSVGEVENLQKNLLHASVRFFARVRGDTGAVAGLFTYEDGSDESDVEILTRDNTTTVRYTNQPAVDNKTGDEVPGASQTRHGLPSWTGWHVHRLDWNPTESLWFVDGELVADSTYSVPRKPSGVVVNMWSDGGEWSGIMPVGDQAELQLQWIEVVFNTSGSRDGPKTGNRSGGNGKSKRGVLGKRKASKNCKVVCAADGVSRVGWPEIRFTADARAINPGRSMVLNLVAIAFWMAVYSLI
jgi:hypothetical protein